MAGFVPTVRFAAALFLAGLALWSGPRGVCVWLAVLVVRAGRSPAASAACSAVVAKAAARPTDARGRKI